MDNQRHYSVEELMGFLDGELSAKEIGSIDHHLRACARCSSELHDLRTAADSYGHLRNEILRNTKAALSPWRPLSTGAVECIPARKLGNSFRIWWSITAACVLMACVIAWLHGSDSREMGRLLQRAASTGTRPVGRLRIRTHGTILFRPAILTRTDESSPPTGSLPVLFEQAHYNWANPLSPRSFADWHGRLADKQDRVTALRDHSGATAAFQLRTTTRSGNLRAVALTLAADTLEPREGRFDFQPDGLVDISVTPAEETRPEGGPNPISTPARAPEKVYTASPASPEDELRVFAALHALGADAEEPIEVRLDAEKSHVLVTGIGISPARRKEIENAFSSMPRVVVAFDRGSDSGDSRGYRDESFATPPPVDTGPATSNSPGEPLFRSVLEMQAGGSEKLQAIVDSTLETSSAALARAHALGTLAHEFSTPTESTLGASRQNTLRRIRSDDSRALVDIGNKLAKDLAPFRIQTAPREIAISSWQAGAAALFENTRALDQLLNKMLAENLSKQDGPNAVEATRRRLSMLLSLASAEEAAAQ
ncbi:MAG TPA: zf-HC2 domain-containing protein [Bryobacteraceae bacterium]|jgi:hypothetical protein|nr:zf-HC2 domain-containing protein [Bryobacteraceae bacterium]